MSRVECRLPDARAGDVEIFLDGLRHDYANRPHPRVLNDQSYTRVAAAARQGGRSRLQRLRATCGRDDAGRFARISTTA